jgi:hypothetical protein
MGCACNAKPSAKATKYTVIKPSGQTYKTYSTKIEAEAAAKRVGGKVKPG